ncbi:hypothetical protein M011DRAFT_479514 [Sporormia fimetaria CBS 119925]|uniref:Secreted protein n=1 Tax=Sporormia fimetaria CBS 119925 TaxID=1340428 RepID=A0A6A6V5F9_9PLEO|nr:hypothetical protein M011DRAFT_479514 [Sporormia fimetaria CBS 119925]
MLVAAIASSVAAVAIDSTAGSPIPGHKVVEIEWDIEVFPGEHKIFNGTVQEVVAKATELNPDFKITVEKRALGSSEPHVEARANLNKRGHINCGYWPETQAWTAHANVDYLRGVSGRPRNGPGPGACGRIACQYGSSIWWCNDNTFTKELDGFNAIANSAQRIIDVCRWNGPGPNPGVFTAGQNFEDSNWNTIVRGGDNC